VVRRGLGASRGEGLTFHRASEPATFHGTGSKSFCVPTSSNLAAGEDTLAIGIHYAGRTPAIHPVSRLIDTRYHRSKTHNAHGHAEAKRSHVAGVP
jgi:hypothetical protein